jgi:tetratricopeptide (TPR) repeat protein
MLIGRAGFKASFSIPFGRNANFVGRDDVLKDVLLRIPPAKYPNDCQKTVVEGLGGIGKTQVALEAAYRLRDMNSECNIFWAAAVNMATFESSCREISDALGLSAVSQKDKDVKTLVKDALSRDDAKEWLLILDNADDIELLKGDSKLLSYLPWSRKGSILFTTRNHQAAVLFQSRSDEIALGVLERPESLRLLHQGLKPSQYSDPAASNELLEFLVDLPLAIRQASAYMASNGRVTTSIYLRQCKASDQKTIKMLSKDFDDQDRYDTTPNPVAATWLISFDQISRDHPLAAEYLRFISYLADKNIPEALLPPGNDDDAHIEALSTLDAYAFTRQRNVSRVFDVHRLVSIAMRNWLEQKGEAQGEVSKMFKHLSLTVTKLGRTPNLARDLLIHTQAALTFGELCNDKTARLSILLYTASAYSSVGKYVDAEPFARQAKDTALSACGENHVNTLLTERLLASILNSLGKRPEAERMYRHVIDRSTNTLGEKAPFTLALVSSLAVFLHSDGRHLEAEEMAQRTLAIWTKLLVEDHGDTHTNMSNTGISLSNIRSSMDDLTELLRQTEMLRRWDTGDPEEVRAYFQQRLESSRRTLGEEDPSTLMSMVSLADKLEDQHDYQAGEALRRDTLEIQKRVLGDQHPDTLDNMACLGSNLSAQRRFIEGESLCRAALQQSRETFGDESLVTLEIMREVASALAVQEKFAEAETLFYDAWQLALRILGEHHFTTLRTERRLERVRAEHRK